MGTSVRIAGKWLCGVGLAALAGGAWAAQPPVGGAAVQTQPAAAGGAGGAASQNVTIVLPPIPSTAGSATVSPEMLAALKALSAEDFKTRQEAVANLQLLMAENFKQMVAVQEMMMGIQSNIATQLQSLTLSPDTDASAKTASLLEFNRAISRWAIDAMALPDEQRKAMLDWGLKPENLVLIAKAYARREDVRTAAARELAKIGGEQTSWLLVQLIGDADREVSLNAMDAVWDRAPSKEIIDALWSRASGYLMMQMRQMQGQRARMITVRGRTIQVYDQDYNAAGARVADGDFAADVLIHYKNATVADKLGAVFTEIGNSTGNPNDYRWRAILPNYGGEGAKTFMRLVEAYKPKECVPTLVKILGTSYNDGGDTTINNNEKVRYSTRIDAAAILIKIIGQDPDDYNIRKYQNWGDRWMLKGGMDEENDLIKKIQKWWKVNAKDYGEDVPGAATQPGELKELKPGPAATEAAPKDKDKDAKAAADAKAAEKRAAMQELQALQQRAILVGPPGIPQAGDPVAPATQNQ